MQGFASCLLFEQEMKLLKKKLHVMLLKVRPSKKRKRSNSHEVLAEKARTNVAKEQIKPTPPMSPVLSTLMSTSLFGIIETSPEAGVEKSNPPTEVGVDAKLEAKTSGHLVEEGEVGPNEETPLPLQGLVELSAKVELTPKMEEM